MWPKGEAKGESELLHVYSEPSKVRLKLPWLSIRRNQRRPDLVDRIQSWRPEAMAMDSKIGALGDPRHDEAPARRRTWHIVAD